MPAPTIPTRTLNALAHALPPLPPHAIVAADKAAREAIATALVEQVARYTVLCATRGHKGSKPATGTRPAKACTACTATISGLNLAVSLIDPDRPR